MYNKNFIISVLIILIVLMAGILIFYKPWQGADNKNYNNFIHSQFKTYCRITEGGLFENSELGIRFSFGDDMLVCDYQSPVPEEGREIYIWRKQAFEKAEPLGQGVIGKVSVNLSLELPKLPQGKVSIKEETLIISGISTKVRVMEQPECKNDLCFTTRIAELTHLGNRFVLEEYNDNVGLLKSFEFIEK